jgi:DNA-binding NtrC family response regulator
MAVESSLSRTDSPALGSGDGGHTVARTHDFVVAVFDDSSDQRELLRLTMQLAGMRLHVCGPSLLAVSDDMVRNALAEAHADVVIWDVSPVFTYQCKTLEALLRSGAFGNCGVVVTTSHAARVREFLGPLCGDMPILEKPYELDHLVAAVNSAGRSAHDKA